MPHGARADMVPLMRELGHLKRITSAGRDGSAAVRLFLDGWRDLRAGAAPGDVALRTTAAAVAAARLGDLDFAKLRELGLDRLAATEICSRAIDAAGDSINTGLLDRLKTTLLLGYDDLESHHHFIRHPRLDPGSRCLCHAAEEADPIAGVTVQGLRDQRPTPPKFALQLAQQPRAGVTCPGKARLILGPAENHAEHSLVVAVYAVLVAPDYDADPADAFLAGMAHHLHNAIMPDSGFTGEMLLGTHLDDIIARARDAALSEVPLPLREHVETLLAAIATDAMPEARAFHAADAIDRVLEIEQLVAASQVTMATVLDDYELVHDGPVKPFHDRTLRAVGLLP